MANISNIQIEDLKLGLKDSVARDMIGSLSVSVDNKIDGLGVNIKNYGCIGDGVVDDTVGFINANTKAIQTNTFLYVPEGVYNLQGFDSNVVASIKGDGKSELNFIGNNILKYDSDFELKNIDISNDYISDTGSSGSLIIPVKSVDKITVENVNFNVKTDNLDGSRRGKTLIRIKAKQVNIKNFYAENSKMPVIVDNVDSGLVDFVSVDGYKVVNAQTGIYITSGDARIERPITNVNINNISLVNTPVQGTHYTQANGSDVIMMEFSKDVVITNVSCENVCERALYINVVDNIIIENVFVKGSTGVKVCGLVNKTTNTYNYSSNIVVKNIVSTDGYEKTPLEFYEVKNVFVDGVSSYNSYEKSNHRVISLQRSCENVKITNVNGKNSKRSVIELDGKFTNTYDAHFKDIEISNVSFINPANMNKLYSAIECKVASGGTIPYVYEDIKIDNVHIENRVVDWAEIEHPLPYYPNAHTLGIIGIDNVNGLDINNVSAMGISNINGGINVGSDSVRVKIDTKLKMVDNLIPYNTHCSPGSVIECMNDDANKKGFVNNRVVSYSNPNNFNGIDIGYSHMGDIYGSVTLNAGWDRKFIKFLPEYQAHGVMEVECDNGEYMTVRIFNGALTLVDGSANVSVTNVSGKICTYIGSNDLLYIRNRLATPVRINVKIKYSRG